MDWVKEKMYQARLQRNKLQENGNIRSPDNRKEENVWEPAIRTSRLLPFNQKFFWLAGGVALGVVLVSIARQVDLNGRSDEVLGNTLEQRHQLMTLPVSSNNNEMKEELIHLTEQVQMLTATVADLQTILLENHVKSNTLADLGKAVEPDGSHLQAKATDTVTQLEALPPPAAGLENEYTPEAKQANKSVDITRGTLTASIQQATGADERKPQDTTKESGPWVINLVSLPHKIDVERFLEKAESRGVDADLYQVTVKGKTYWRVHVSGFASSTEAKSHADMIKEKLGLKDVWVAKR